MVIQHSRQQIVGCSYSMKVPRKMKVYIFHGNYLRMPASGSSALYAEYRSQRRFSESCDGVFAYLSESVGKPYRRSGLSLSRRSRRYGRNQDQLAVRLIFFISEKRVVNLSFVLSVLLQVFFVYPCRLGNLSYLLLFALLRNLNVAFKYHIVLLYKFFKNVFLCIGVMP